MLRETCKGTELKAVSKDVLEQSPIRVPVVSSESIVVLPSVVAVPSIEVDTCAFPAPMQSPVDHT